MGWAGACNAYGRGENCIQYFALRTEDKRPLGRTRGRWKDSTGMDLKEI
jgi:hypothetical protein